MQNTKRQTKRQFLATLCGAAATTLPWARAWAQPVWPMRPVRILVGFPGGSTPDLTARVIAEPLSHALGQPVIVENRPGASGNIATDLVAKATDGHTLGIVINGNLTSSKLLYPKLPYDPATDFTFLSLLTTAPLVLVAQPGLPSGAAFFKAARQAGNTWNYGSVGIGSLAHLGMELLQSRVPGMAAVNVPYPGNPQVVTAMLGGQIQMALIPPGIAAPQVKAGRLKAIGVAGGRSALMPEAPPLSEAGVRGFDLEVWNALLGPARLPQQARQRITGTLAQIMKMPEVRQRLFDHGWQAVGTSPEGMAVRVKEETGMMRRIISAKEIRID